MRFFLTLLSAWRRPLYTICMLHVSKSLPYIAVLRGGSEDFATSLFEGQEVLKSLSKIGYKPLDVLIDSSGNWTTQGVPTDAHYIYTRAHTVVDTTRDHASPHIALAKRMGITLLFSKHHSVQMDREDMYRLLRMQGIAVPDTTVIRSKAPLNESTFREIWSKQHIPLMIRPLQKDPKISSCLVSSFPEFENAIKEYHEKGIDIHVLTYRKEPTSSLAILPHFRGEKLYTPLWVETFGTRDSLPSRNHIMKTYVHAPEFRKQNMKDMALKVYDALNLSGPACIDVIPYNNGYMVVNVERSPSLRKDGRFLQSLSSTGIDIGQYIHSIIEQDLQNNNHTSYESPR